MPREALNCLMCGDRMKKVGLASGVEIDCCDAHGVWLDVGELQQIITHHERPGGKEGLATKLLDSATRGAGAGLGWSIASALIRRLFG